MKQRLIDAALNQYAKHGYDGASMRKIATEVNIKPASIYFFYKDKKQLFIAAFQQLLENHFLEMQRILQENKDKSIESILKMMIHGLAKHHTGNKQATIAYISFVASPLPEMKAYLQDHMQRYNDWLVDSLEIAIKDHYPSIASEKIDRIIKQFVLIGNGVFWGIQLYEGERFTEQVELADQMLHTLFFELEKTSTV